MRKESLISYAMSFASFLLDDLGEEIDRIILFGSVARGSHDKDSDIDLFIDTKKNLEKPVQKSLSLFLQSAVQKKWELKGLKAELSVKIGELKKWKLRRDIISDGIILYGKMKEVPENTEYYLLLRPSFRKFSQSHKVRLWRRLYGYKQKVGSKVYSTAGLVETLGGRRIENGILLPMKNKKQVLEFLNSERIPYTVNELWSDTF